MTSTIQTTREDHRIAWLTALAVAIHVVESAFPSPLPGVKPGLANVITIIVLLQYGWKSAAWVSVLRVLVGSLLLGSFLSPTFMLSLSGALASIVVLRMALWIPNLGAVGCSVLAAMAHMAGQFWTAYTLFIPHPALFHLLPVLMTAAVVFGLVSGLIAQSVVKTLERPVS